MLQALVSPLPLSLIVVKANVFLKDMNDFAAMNEVYSEGEPPLSAPVYPITFFRSLRRTSPGSLDRASRWSSSSESHPLLLAPDALVRLLAEREG